MRQAIYNQAKDFNKSLFPIIMGMMGINRRSSERLIQEQFGIISKCLEGTVKQLEIVRDAKDVSSYFTAQSEQVQKWPEQLAFFMKEGMKILSNTQNEFDALRRKGLFEISLPSLVPNSKTT